MPEPYDTLWYASRGKELGVSGRCPYANVHSCPRYFESLSLLGGEGITTPLSKSLDKKLEAEWKQSKLWPVVVESASSVINRNIFKNFCPENSFNTFQQFATDLSRHGDSIDRDEAYRALEREGNVSATDWRWEWSLLTPMHFAECPLHSQLDLGSFATTPHAKHFFGNCGNDSVWSDGKIVSTPLKPLHDQFNNSNTYVQPDRSINLDEYPGKHFDIWSSTPAVVWTANRPQEKGIHVHIYEGNIGGRRIVDNTFSEVIYKGVPLDRKLLWKQMTENTLY